MARLFLTISIVFISVLNVLCQDWKEREDWPENFPRPELGNERLFFIQRNLNVNTISYDLNLLSNGNINERDPIDNYWMRYTGNRNGIREDLTWFQQTFAFGYDSKKDSKNGGFQIKLTAYKDRNIHLKKVNNEWVAIMEINGKPAQLSNLYVYADESGMMPKVIHVDIFGVDMNTKKQVHERFFNN